MEIDKAIELNKESEISLRKGKFHDHADAVKLGQEALKRFSVARKHGVYIQPTLLLGETPITVISPSKDQIKKLRESPIGEK